jgi:hypothetical protein
VGRAPKVEQIPWDDELRTYIIQKVFDVFGCADTWKDDTPPNDLGQWNQCQYELVMGVKRILEGRDEYQGDTGKELPVVDKPKIHQQLRWALTTQDRVLPNHEKSLDPCKEIAVRVGLIRAGGPMDFRYRDRCAS